MLMQLNLICFFIWWEKVGFLKRQFRILQFLRSLLAYLFKKYLLKTIVC